MSRTRDKRPGPVGGKRDLNRRRRVEQLQRAALALFLRRGVTDVTVDDIVARARLAKGSFYRYFDDKEALVTALLEPLASQLRAALTTCEAAHARAASAGDLGMAYLAFATALARLVGEHPQVVRLYLQEAHAPAAGPRRPIRTLADEIARRALELGRATHRLGAYRMLDPRVVTLVIVGAAERLLFEHLAREPFPDPAGVAFALVSIVTDGLAP